MFDLSSEDIDKIQRILAKYHQVEEAIVYGSRAKGSNRPGSDLDLALKGQDLNLHLLNKISRDLDELLLPYNIDLSIHHRINNPDLLDHIERVGKVIYKKVCQ